MRYNPNYHHRRSIRLPEYDYSQFGYYFVTVCTHNRELYFGDIQNNKMILNDAGKIVHKCWLKIPEHFEDARLGGFVVMSNHVHLIIVLKKFVGARFIAPRTNAFNKSCSGIIYDAQGFDKSGFDKSNPYSIENNPMLSNNITLGKIIRYCKAKTTYEIRKFVGEDFIRHGYFAWQRNYYERIIRNNQELNRIRNYIINNPLNWETDRNNPNNIKNL